MAAERAVLWPLLGVANVLIASMGLLFVPAGVGIIAELGVLRRDWLAILAGVLVSTVLGLVVTGLVMHQISRRQTRRRAGSRRGVGGIDGSRVAGGLATAGPDAVALARGNGRGLRIRTDGAV